MKNSTRLLGNEDYEVVERELPYQGVFRLARYHVRHKLFNGEWSRVFTLEMLERRSAVAIMLYDPTLDRVILIEQFRIGALANPTGPWLLEIVAGVIKPNENPKEVAIREALEEAGCHVQALYPLYEYFVSPGGSNEYLHVYIGKIDSKNIGGFHGLADENEDIRVLNLSFEEAMALLNRGEIKTVPAILTLQWLELHRKKLPTLWEKI